MPSIGSTLLLAKRAQYKLRRNVGLDTAESSRTFKNFQTRVAAVIREQVKRVVENDQLISDLLFLLNKVEADQNMVSYLKGKFPAFNAVFAEIFGDDSLTDFYIWAGESGGQAVLDRMGFSVQFILRNDAVTEWLKIQENLLIKSMDQTTIERLIKIIQEGREGLLTDFEIKQLITERFQDISEYRAEAIARTELANAFNGVEFETFKRNGVQRVRWVTVQDERVCPICEPLHNEVVNLGNAFVGITQRPPAHTNCRCFLEEVIEGVVVRDNLLVWAGA